MGIEVSIDDQHTLNDGLSENLFINVDSTVPLTLDVNTFITEQSNYIEYSMIQRKLDIPPPSIQDILSLPGQSSVPSKFDSTPGWLSDSFF